MSHGPALPRRGQRSTRLSRKEFIARWRQQFVDPLYRQAEEALQQVEEIAWQAYDDSHKAPRTKKAGKSFADPTYDISIDWLNARAAIRAAERERSLNKPHFLVINGSARNEHTCPSETPKSFRLTGLVEATLKSEGACTVERLDLSLLTAEYGRRIYPCKGCVSTAMPLCHWPCSCYPNHGLGQTQDWMNDIYTMWARCDGVVFVSPVYWYEAPSALKLMIDRLVCADGGNPDPTTTHGKHPREARALELKGWPYPKHLAGRAFGIIVQADAAGVDSVATHLHDWLTDMGLIAAAPSSTIGRYVGYYQPYANNQRELEVDTGFHEETRNVARAVFRKVKQLRAGDREADTRLRDPRPK